MFKKFFIHPLAPVHYNSSLKFVIVPVKECATVLVHRKKAKSNHKM